MNLQETINRLALASRDGLVDWSSNGADEYCVTLATSVVTTSLKRDGSPRLIISSEDPSVSVEISMDSTLSSLDEPIRLAIAEDLRRIHEEARRVAGGKQAPDSAKLIDSVGRELQRLLADR